MVKTLIIEIYDDLRRITTAKEKNRVLCIIEEVPYLSHNQISQDIGQYNRFQLTQQ